jgi:hypothetical protein
MPDFARTVPVTLDVDPDTAAALQDPATRARVERLISRVLHPRPGASQLAQAVADAKAEASSAGLTDADIDAELDAYNAERRASIERAEADELVKRFRAFRVGKTLGGLDIKELIAEGRR